MSRQMLIPGPDHPITLRAHTQRLVVKVSGRIVAETTNALTLQESHYPPVHYIPREDTDMSLLRRSDHATYCPYKGECSYYSIPIGGARSDNAVWSYEAPYESVASIKNYLAFYPDRIDPA